jgi:hypothetical protein
MNNRNQQQTNRTPAPTPASAPTYLNVFTVEEYESNGKPANAGPKSAPPSLTRKAQASASN